MIKNLLTRLLPLEKLFALALKFGLLSKPLDIAAKAWARAQGARTQGLLGLGSALALAASLGYVPWEFQVGDAVIHTSQLIAWLLGLGSASAADKWNSVSDKVRAGSEAVAAEAKKDTPPA